MVEELVATRTTPLSGTYGGSGLARLVIAGDATRLSVRAGEEALGALSGALDIELPRAPLSASVTDGGYAFWLGPDEWLVINEHGEEMIPRLQGIEAPFSAVDVSHRNVAVTVVGPGAAAAINAACPQDLRPDRFPVGKVVRTVLGKAEIVLFRKEENTFRIECWRSFAPYVFGLLDQAAKDTAY
nr:sarcosine oxidase subunit gamma family protein [Marinicella sp. W31]MDC2876339.1 sarcosine oxidase subunit gamma family protein [Marinicella sp. W31]